jgi:hypothetical protein
MAVMMFMIRHAPPPQRSVDQQLHHHRDEAGRDHAHRHHQEKWQHREQPQGRQPAHGSQHHQLTLGKMDDAGCAHDHRETEGHQTIHAADGESADQQVDELGNTESAHRVHLTGRLA